jgi:hypothetical protein
MQRCGSGSRINIPDYFSKGLETVFLAWKQFLKLKILNFFDADPDPGSGIFLTHDPGNGMQKFGSRIRDKHLGSATLLVCKYRM